MNAARSRGLCPYPPLVMPGCCSCRSSSISQSPPPFAEVEAVPVDLAFPLLGHLTAVAAHDDARLIGQPRLQVSLGGVLIGLELSTFR